MLFRSDDMMGAVIGKWTPGDGKKISAFKFKRVNVLTTGKKNYYNGYCQFMKSAKAMNGSVTFYDVPSPDPDGHHNINAMPVDIYFYYRDTGNQTTVRVIPGESYETEDVVAMACLPKNARFFNGKEKVELTNWLHDAQMRRGYSIQC